MSRPTTDRCTPGCYHPTRRDLIAGHLADVALRLMSKRTRRIALGAFARAIGDEHRRTHPRPVSDKRIEVVRAKDRHPAIEAQFGKAGADYIESLKAAHPDGLLADAVREIERKAIERSRKEADRG